MIGVHSGTFHLDDTLSCFMLKLLPEYKNHQVVRTRDKMLLSKCDVVVDVGFVYDPSIHRYDHHHETFNEKFSKQYTTKLCGAGLIFKHFGLRVLSEIVETEITEENKDNFNFLLHKIYRDFVEGIDGYDNRISRFDSMEEPKYCIVNSLPNRIKRLNPGWTVSKRDDEEMMVRFNKALQLAGSEFVEFVKHVWDTWIPAYPIVLRSIKKSLEINPLTRVVELESGCPWLEHLLYVEEQLNLKGRFQFVVFLSEFAKQLGEKWIAKAIPISNNSQLINRTDFPEKWCGLEVSDLRKITKIQDAHFCHKSGFLAVSRTKKGIYQMTEKALKLKKKQIEN
ncbi:metal dependent hydrolase - related [Anaeramoeba flamelloides]|uniref:Metal dependent hydrolase - related n=1 Tax=Anaeramoeba flamelloides TaxID=1746091 RepID=A0ABQ8XFL4_9EUKA|nr:metal dependent hydrolase - related [Anaeramoeba flamelloides]